MLARMLLHVIEAPVPVDFRFDLLPHLERLFNKVHGLVAVAHNLMDPLSIQGTLVTRLYNGIVVEKLRPGNMSVVTWPPPSGKKIVSSKTTSYPSKDTFLPFNSVNLCFVQDTTVDVN